MFVFKTDKRKYLKKGSPEADSLKKDLKWIFFDVGSTFVSETECHLDRYIYFKEEIEKKTGRPFTTEDFDDVMYEGVAKGHNPVPYFKKHFKLSRPVPLYKQELEIVFPEVPDALERLSKQYKLGVIANQREGLPARLESYGLMKYLVPEAVLGSVDVGINKPDPQIFNMALSVAGCNPGEALMVGDHALNDVKAAGALGIKTCRLYREYFAAYYPKDDSEIEDVAIDDLAQLADLLCD